jgi:hypothetical protein
MNQILISSTITLLDIIYRPVYFSKHNVSETGLCLRLQVKPTQLGPIDRASPHLRTPIPATRWGIPSQPQHKPSATAKKTLIFKLCTYEALNQRTITKKIITQSTLDGVVFFFYYDNGVQMGEMSKLGWLIGWSQTFRSYDSIPCAITGCDN